MEKLHKNSDAQDRTEAKNIKTPAPRKGKKPPKRITEKYLYNAGLAYLQRFPASTPHFRRVMGRKIDRSCNYHKDQDRETCVRHLDSTVETLSRMGLLNDDAWLRGMVNSLRRRGLSRQAIMAKLAAKGMAQGPIQEALSTHAEETGTANPDLAAAVLLCRRKKIGPFAAGQNDDRDDKALAALARAGFGFDVARRALSMDSDDAQKTIDDMRI